MSYQNGSREEAGVHRQVTDSQMIFESHQLLFDRIIPKLPASAKLLAKIKFEYESVLRKIAESRNNLAARTLQENLYSTEIATLSNHHKRVRELEVKLEKIKADNTRIQNQLDRMRLERYELIKGYEERLQDAKLKMSLKTKSIGKETLSLPLDEATSVNFLESHLLRVAAKLLEAQEVTEKKYVPGQRKSQLQDQLKGKETSRNVLSSENKILANMLRRLKVAMKAVESYLPYLKEQNFDPSSVPIETYIRAVIADHRELEEDISDEDPEDPAKDMEAEMILDCYEKFNELFESEMYEEAALHAATSPKGVLRTLKTLLLFKSSARHQPDKKLPLLSYCEYLLQCAPAFRPISLQESIECAKCILTQGDLDKLLHWVAQGALPASAELGSLVFKNCSCSKQCKCGRKSLAFTVFDQCQAFNPAAICLVQQGKYMNFLSFTSKARLSKHEYVDMLCVTPSADFAMLLVNPPKPYTPILNMFELVKLLLEKGYGKHAVQYLRAYLKGCGLSLVQAVMNDSKLDQDLLEEVVCQLHRVGFEETALDLVSSWVVKSAVHRSIQQLDQESREETPNQHSTTESNSSIADTESGTGSSSQSEESTTYEMESDGEETD